MPRLRAHGQSHPLPLACLCALLLAGPAVAGAEVEAITEPRHDLSLGFTVPGQVGRVLVEPGEVVAEGDVLIELIDREEAAVKKLWKLRAEASVPLESAKAQHELAELEARRLKDLLERNAAAPFEYERARISAQVARLRVEEAAMEQKEAAIQLEQAEARHARFRLRAPTDGVVEELIVDEGETVEQLNPVLRLVTITPLRINADVETARTLDLAVGDPAWVTFQMPGHEDRPVEGEIVHLASVADAASGTRLVRVEVPNEQDLPAGGVVTVYFTPPEALAAE